MTTLVIPSLQPEPLTIAPILPSPCTQACPAGINVKGYVSLIAEGRHAEALETIRRRCPLPAICGRICHHPCEKACRRGRYDDAVAIRGLKRFVADYADDLAPPRLVPITRTDRIAVVGSGPAGLTAAYDLRLAGYGVTVFEAAPEAGGMLRYGIADYRLPAAVLDREIDILVRSGVEIVTDSPVGTRIELDDLLYRGYSATLLAVGAQRGRLLGLEGERETRNVEDALSFLKRVQEGGAARLDGRVVVIGGGSTAVEAARTAIRLGAASVEILYRRYREELLADHEEIAAAEAEGVNFRFLVTPRRLLRTANRLTGLECVQIGLGEPDRSGRRRPIEIPGSEFAVAAEYVYAAVGQEVDTTFLPNELIATIARRDRLLIDPETSMTSIPGIFAAGDAVTGPATVVEAIGAGHHAAESIRHFLEQGQAGFVKQKPERRAPVEYEIADGEPVRSPRMSVEAKLPSDHEPFAETERTFSTEEAIAEARRCLRCGPCGECRSCAPSCSRRHLVVSHDKDTLVVRAPAAIVTSLPSHRRVAVQLDQLGAEIVPLRCRADETRCRVCSRCIDICSFGALRIVDERIRLDAALCRGCGLCAAICPTGALQWSGATPARHAGDAARIHVIACERRTGGIETSVGNEVVVTRVRCAGQLDAGTLVELQRLSPAQILVAGCTTDRCRFTTGARHAQEQLDRARSIAACLGVHPSRFVADWSPDRAGDPLSAAVVASATEQGGDL
jgi:NADPH-dependent glutamate synthase beta subunit-like oxidoreductase/Fe-S-cluster-containing hydrogenase component 2